MKVIDKFLQAWRVELALREIPESSSYFFDIGCDDSYLLRRIKKERNFKRLDGCDPRLDRDHFSENSILLKGFFPDVLNHAIPTGVYDVIFALAVFEHFTEKNLSDSADAITNMLSDDGVLVVTVPHPFVDKILDCLLFLRLIDGQALDEHHGFDPKSLVQKLSKSLILVKTKKFQFGLNNIFVLKKSIN